MIPTHPGPTLRSRRSGGAILLVALLAAVLFLSACGESADSSGEFTSEWPDDKPLPAATVDAASEDGGIVIDVALTNFVISSPAAEDADGHLHISVDGGAAQMTFETTVVLGELAPGTHEVHVGFVANDHSSITADGEQVGSMAVVEIAPDGSVVEVRSMTP